MTESSSDVPLVPVPAPARAGHVRLAVLVSGGGTTMQNLAERMARGTLPAEMVLCIASNDHAFGLERARRLGIPTQVIRRRDHASTQAFSETLFAAVRAAEVDFVAMAGFLSLLHIPDDFARRVVNIHPSLLPSFGGQGMHGRHVHEAVLAHGCRVSGCTVHFADQTFDTGPILVQRACPVAEDDTPDTLAARVFEEECEAYPQALRLLAGGGLVICGRRVERISA